MQLQLAATVAGITKLADVTEVRPLLVKMMVAVNAPLLDAVRFVNAAIPLTAATVTVPPILQPLLVAVTEAALVVVLPY